MTNKELDQAFAKAQHKWLAANRGVGYNSTQQRYFFFAGSQFGAEVTKEIYNETFNRAKANLDDAAEANHPR